MRIEVHIDRLVVDDPGARAAGARVAGEFATAVTQELRRVLARDLGRARVTAPRAMSVPRLRTVPAPAAGGATAGATAASAGRALGAALAATMTPHHPGR
jgi:hypothetical protein